MEVVDRPEEEDLRVLATAAGIDRIAKANVLSPFETTIAMKLAMRKLLDESRAPMAMIHQCRGLLLELELELGSEFAISALAVLPEGKEVA